MLKLGKAACLIVVAAASVMAMAQSQQVRQPSQPRPAATPAPATGTAPTTAPAARPARPSPDSRRFVTNENFFHARPKTQPANTDAQATTAQPAGARSTAVKSTQPVTRQVLPPAGQPATTVSVPSMPAPQPAALPVFITPSTSDATHDLAAVGFSHGELTVVAQRAPLGLVLKLIAAKTGAIVDLAPELQSEPVVARLGPAPPREVLISLLDSPRVDYIILAVGNDPNSVQRVVVRTRQAFASVAMSPIQPSQPRPAKPAPETRLGEDGRPRNGLASVDGDLTQEQRMENWRKAREAMRVAEVKQQAEDREREKTEPQPQPEPQLQAEPQPQPQPQPDNPPQR